MAESVPPAKKMKQTLQGSFSRSSVSLSEVKPTDNHIIILLDVESDGEIELDHGGARSCRTSKSSNHLDRI